LFLHSDSNDGATHCPSLLTPVIGALIPPTGHQWMGHLFSHHCHQ
ncbi:unnamed protein product, partial [Staurois parvus]